MEDDNIAAIVPQNSFSDAEINRNATGIPRYNVQPYKGVNSAPPTLQTTPVFSPRPPSERSIEELDERELNKNTCAPTVCPSSGQSYRNTRMTQMREHSALHELRNRLYNPPRDSSVLKMVSGNSWTGGIPGKANPHPPKDGPPKVINTYRTTILREKKGTGKPATQKPGPVEHKGKDYSHRDAIQTLITEENNNIKCDINNNGTHMGTVGKEQIILPISTKDDKLLNREQYEEDSILMIIYKLRKRLCWTVDSILDGEYPKLVQENSIDTEKVLPKEDDGEFVYCLPKGYNVITARYNPYDLHYATLPMVRSCNIHFTVTATHVTRVSKYNEPLLTPIKDWLYERKMFNRVFNLNVFSKFRLWKTFTVWRRNIRGDKKGNMRESIAESLFLLQPVMQKAILEIKGICESICETCGALSLQQHEEIVLLSLDKGTTYSLERFIQANAEQTAHATELLSKARQRVIDIVLNVCQVVLDETKEKIQAEQAAKLKQMKANSKTNQRQNKSLQLTKAKYGLEEKKSKKDQGEKDKNLYKYIQIAQLKSTQQTLRRFVRYIDFVMMDMLRRLVTASVDSMMRHFRASSQELKETILPKAFYSNWVEERERQTRKSLDLELYKESDDSQVAIPAVVSVKFVLSFPRPGSGSLSRMGSLVLSDPGHAKKSVSFQQRDANESSSKGTPSILNTDDSSTTLTSDEGYQREGFGRIAARASDRGEGFLVPIVTLEPNREKIEREVLRVIHGFEHAVAAFKSLLKDPSLDKCTSWQEENELSYDRDLASTLRASERPWPSVKLLFTEDPEYQQNISDILTIIQTEMKTVHDFSKDYDQYCDMVSDAKSIDVEKSMAERQWSTEQFNAVLSQFTEQLSAMQNMVIQKRYGMILVEAEEFRDSCLPFTHRIISLVAKNLPVLACRRNEGLLKIIKNAEDKLHKVPTNVEAFVEHLNFLSKTANDLPALEKEYKIVCKMFVIAINFNITFESEKWALYQTLTPSFHQLKTTVLYCEANRDENIQRFMKELQKMVTALYQNSVKLKNRTRNPTLLDEDVMPAAAMENLKLLEEELAILRENSISYADYQEKFANALSASLRKKKYRVDPDYQRYNELDPNRPATVQDLRNELSEVERDLTLRKLLWESIDEWKTMIAQWESTSFAVLKVEDLQREVTRFVQTVFLLEKGLPPNPVVPSLKHNIMNFRSVMPIISSLRNPALRPRHWEKIQVVMGTGVVKEKTFTLGNFLGLDILDKKDGIAEISSQASNEATLELMLNRVTEFWNHADFQLVAHTGRDIAVITGADEIFTAVDESLVTLGNIRSSRYSEPIEAIVDEWERKLLLFSKCFEEWMLVQRNWLYLETIFSAADIQRQLTQESRLFNQVDKNWKDIMRRTIDRPNALKAGTAVGVLEILQSCKTNLEKIHRGLEDYLETKRAVFARFYFLSNDELLDILSNTRNYNAVQPHLPKCFGNIHRFEFQKQDNSPPNVVALMSEENEYLPLTRPVRVRGTVEQWLLNVEGSMFDTVKLHLKKAMTDYDEDSYIDWLLSHPGQVGLTVSLIMFTSNVTKALSSSNAQDGLKGVHSSLVNFLDQLSALVSRSLEQHRFQLAVSLIIIMVHSRDIVAQLIKDKVSSVSDFSWTRNLRYCWDDTNNTCLVHQSVASFSYGYEYLGCSSRLVITPLTNRCYLTLTGALSLNLGGSPVGPAGTGKTETVKDLAKGMGKQCLVFNCSEGLEHKMIAKLLLGLAQSGSWCCLDEFNRIDVEVLSVVAQQLHAIKAAKDTSSVRFVFEGRDIRLNSSCGIFITMNPGYAGRVELPDNLKSLFRPVAMVVPDFALITEIILFSEGFRSAATLSRKLINLYQLASKQLSQQDHYDFGLRAVKSVLVMAGQKMRSYWLKSGNMQCSLDEESGILISAVVSANAPKFIAEDVLIFQNILRDIFPGVDTQEHPHGQLEKAIGISLRELGLQRWQSQINKVIQLHDTLLLRHGAMLVGPTGGGKTVTRQILRRALALLPVIHAGEREDTRTESSNADAEAKTSAHHSTKKANVDVAAINPKCVTLGKLYGEFNQDTMDWRDGLLASVVRNFAKKSAHQVLQKNAISSQGGPPISRATSAASKKSFDAHDDRIGGAGSEVGTDHSRPGDLDWQWVILDGPVDTLWIENLNTVLDDTKALCLANGERISMTPSMRMIFEVDDLSQASPATISRCGMVYLDPAELGWRPYVRSWMSKLRDRKVPENGRDFFYNLFEHTVDPGLQFLAQHGHHQHIRAPELSVVGTLCNILDALINFLASSGGFGDQEKKVEAKKKGTDIAGQLHPPRRSARLSAKKKNFLCNNPSQLISFFGKLYAFAYIWAFGANFDSPPDDTDEVHISFGARRTSLRIDADVRFLFDTFVRELFESERSFNIKLPNSRHPLSSYYIDFDKGQFNLWESLVPSTAALIEKSVANKMAISDTLNELDDPSPNSTDTVDRTLIPTANSVRFSFVIALLALNGTPVLLTGDNGVGKTLLINDVLRRVSQKGGTGTNTGTILGAVFASGSSNILESIVASSSEFREEATTTIASAYRLQFSSQTPTDSARVFLESKLVKTGKEALGAKAGEQVLLFIDDLNVPQPEAYGAQPPLELLREIMSSQGYYDADKMVWKDIKDVTLLCACSPTGGGHYPLSPRLLRHFSVLCLPQHSVSALHHIYQTKLGRHLERQDFNLDIKGIRKDTVAFVLGVYHSISMKLRPTPSKCHYLFNLRDVTKVFDGLLNANPASIKSVDHFSELLAHEVTRVFHDRLVNENDRRFVGDVLVNGFRDLLKYKWKSENGSPVSLLFGDFLDTHAIEKERIYSRIGDMKRLKQALEDHRDRATFSGKDIFSNLVFYPEAMTHVVRACRVLRQQGNHMLMVGVGGSGKSLIAQMAAHIEHCVFIQPKLTRNYSVSDFREDIKKVFQTAGIQMKKTILFLNDRNIVKDDFFEYVCTILNCGEITDLFDNDDKERIAMDLRREAISHGIRDNQEDIYQFFLATVRNKLHLVISTSPSGNTFRERCRTYPAIVNFCTVDWFDEWSTDALLAVANASIASITFDKNQEQSCKLASSVAEMLKVVHIDIQESSEQFYLDTQRRHYTTPRSYLRLIDLFRDLHARKNAESTFNKERLTDGLRKLSESNELVSTMQQELNLLGPKLEQREKLTEEILEQLAKDQEALDKVRSVVQKEEELTDRETKKVEQAAEDAQKDLDSVLPQVEAALAALDALDKNDIAEIRVYSKPPTMVMTVLSAVCILLEQKPDWSTAKLLLGDPGFLKRLVNYDKNSISDKIYAKMKRITKHPDFTPTAVGKISSACKSMCQWVLALQHYTQVYRLVEPRQKKCEEAQAALSIAREKLREKKEALAEVQGQVEALQNRYDESVADLESLKERKALTILRIQRASILTKALENEQTRWATAVEKLVDNERGLLGDTLLSAAAVAYLGAFTTSYRNQLILDWKANCQDLEIPFSKNYSIIDYMTEPVQVQKWNSSNLPSDPYSIENAIFVKFSHCWPYIIDPQEQAMKWITDFEKTESLQICKASDPNAMKVLEDAMRLGRPVLLEDAKESLDPALDPILHRNVVVRNNQTVLMIGENEIVYNDKFRLYIVTKIANPHLLPEDCTKVNMINFTITFEALRDQLLSDVVRQERPDLETQRTTLLQSLVSDRLRLRQLEDRSLDLLHSAQGNILDDEELIETLDHSRQVAVVIQQRVKASEDTEKNINKSRSIYTPVAHRGAILYMVTADMALVDIMYQFSLAWFKSLFSKCIAPDEEEYEGHAGRRESHPQSGQMLAEIQTARKTSRRESVRHYRDIISHDKYLEMMVKVITETIYRTVSHSLFARHRLLFSFYLCCKVHLQEGGGICPIDYNEWDWFLRGSQGSIVDDFTRRKSNKDLGIRTDSRSLDTIKSRSTTESSVSASSGISKPSSFQVTQETWKECTKVSEALPSFRGICFHITGNQVHWEAFLTCEKPVEFLKNGFTRDGGRHDSDMDLWDPSSLTTFQRLIVIKIFRPEYLLEALRDFVSNVMGEYFVDPPGFDLRELFDQSGARTPLIFILSPGSDPTNQLLRFAKEVRGSTLHLDLVSLGRGQGPRAEELIKKAYAQYGRWIFLQNCHLAGSFMPKLQEIVREINNPNTDVDPQFRLWLSSKPHPDFPISILQAGLKMTVEPPPGIKANLKRSFAPVGGIVTKESYEDIANSPSWRKLVYGLCLFHAVVQERKKFGSQGWNIPYDFISSDLEVAVLTLSKIIEGQTDIPWRALRLLTGDIIYGGRVTDRWDQRCLLSILKMFYNDQVLSDDYKYCQTVNFRPPSSIESFEDCIEFLETLPNSDPPDIFGMHSNADHEYSKGEAKYLLTSLASMQPRLSSSDSLHKSNDDIVIELATEILRTIPSQMSQVVYNVKRAASSSATNAPTPTSAKLSNDSTIGEESSNVSAFVTFLKQEKGYYNRLLKTIHKSLTGLLAALKGDIIMSEKFEATYDALFQNRLPSDWQNQAYASAMALGSWVNNLFKRVTFIANWLEQNRLLATQDVQNRPASSGKQQYISPYAYWLPGFFFPQGFLTAVLQSHARQFNVSIDSLSYEYDVTEELWAVEPENTSSSIDITSIAFKIDTPPDTGALVFGLYLDGGQWDPESRSIAECTQGQRFCPMPIIYLKPIKHPSTGAMTRSEGEWYECPLYRTSTRATSLSQTAHGANFVTSITLPTAVEPEHWIRRGVAMLCEIEN